MKIATAIARVLPGLIMSYSATTPFSSVRMRTAS